MAAAGAGWWRESVVVDWSLRWLERLRRHADESVTVRWIQAIRRRSWPADEKAVQLFWIGCIVACAIVMIVWLDLWDARALGIRAGVLTAAWWLVQAQLRRSRRGR